MAYQGGCHCGAIAYHVDAELPATAISCNCSHCRDKGLLLTFVPEAAFKLDKGADSLTSYRFTTGKIEHLFCAACGMQSFAKGSGPDGKAMRAVNLRSVPSADLDALTLELVDGAGS